MRNLSAQRPDSPLTYRTGTLNLPAHPDESWRSHQPASRVRWSPRKRNVAEEIGNVRESASPRPHSDPQDRTRSRDGQAIGFRARLSEPLKSLWVRTERTRSCRNQSWANPAGDELIGCWRALSGGPVSLTYAIGDIHGCNDLLLTLLDAVDDHAGGRPYKLVFLGDYIDRGLDSAGVIETVRSLQRTSPGAVIC